MRKEILINLLNLYSTYYKQNNIVLMSYCSIFHKIEKLFQENFENAMYISPYDFISWAMTKQSIKVPQQMIDWKLEQAEKANKPTYEQLEQKVNNLDSIIQKKNNTIEQQAKRIAELEKNISLLEQKTKDEPNCNPRAENTYLSMLTAIFQAKDIDIEKNYNEMITIVEMWTQKAGCSIDNKTVKRVFKTIKKFKHEKCNKPE